MDLRVLVYAMSAEEGAVAERVLIRSGVPAQAVSGPAQLREELARGVGALLVMEEALGGPVLEVVTAFLAAQPAWSDLPILMLTKRGADSIEAQRAVEHLGNVTLLERPVRTMALVSAARSTLRGRRRQYEVRALNERKDQMLATLAHELRNPLAPIANAALVLERMYPAAQVARLTEVIRRQTSHLTRLVDDLLDVGRIATGKVQLQLGPTTVSQVVGHALEIADAALKAGGHHVTVKQPDRTVGLLADHVRLVQGLSNLLVNAAKFTPPGGEIALTVKADASWVEFTVTDSGRGIEPQALERIFEMFEQARAVGEPSAGLGLGLHLARAFAELHGGKATARSAGAGKGSEFTLGIPIVDAGQRPPVHAHGSTRGELPRRVLVVDDNVDAAQTLQALLSLHGLSTAVVHDGPSAIEHVRAHSPDVVIMDIGMPGMNGYEAARQIRRAHPDSGIVLIALTGWGQYADKARAAEAGFDHHFVKPLRADELMACLAMVGAAGRRARIAHTGAFEPMEERP